MILLNIVLKDIFKIRNISSGPNVSHLYTLQNILSTITFNDSEDVWTWSVGGSTFTVKSARYRIDQGFLPDHGHVTRWNNLIPKKINIFIWRALRDRLPSRWNLSRKGIEMNSLNCPICDAGIDCIFHTLWICSLASLVWIRVFNWLDLPPPSISNLMGLFTWIDDSHLSHINKSILDVICSATLWSLWSFRNETIFGSDLPKRSLLYDKIVDFSFRWYSSRCKSHSISWNNWIQNPLVVSSM
ncbi:reverse transcriptase domain, reverse transcriptase zinc-binding domain protein [Tanacetum coccineum]